MAGCDSPDFRDVVFKLPQEDPEAYRTSLRLFFLQTDHGAEASEVPPLEGPPQPLERRYRQLAHSALPGIEGVPLAERDVRLDGLLLRTDRRGRLTAEGLREGYHALSLLQEGQGSQDWTVRLEKHHLTLGIMEYRNGRWSGSLKTVPWTSLPRKHYRALVQDHRQIRDAVRAVLSPRSLRETALALDDDYRDRDGRRMDLLKAIGLKLRGPRAEALLPPPVVALARIGEDQASVEATTVTSEGRTRFHVLTLNPRDDSVLEDGPDRRAPRPEGARLGHAPRRTWKVLTHYRYPW